MARTFDKATFVMDRGYDDNKMFLKLDDLKQDYVIRLTAKRKLFFHGKWVPATQLRNQRKGKIKTVLCYKGKKHEAYLSHVKTQITGSRKSIIPLRSRVPSRDTFGRVFSLMDTEQLQQVTVQLLTQNLSAIKKALGMDGAIRQICVDGNEQRGTDRRNNGVGKVKNLQTLHVYNASNSVCLYSEAISEKTNEIPIAQDIPKKWTCETA